MSVSFRVESLEHALHKQESLLPVRPSQPLLDASNALLKKSTFNAAKKKQASILESLGPRNPSLRSPRTGKSSQLTPGASFSGSSVLTYSHFAFEMMSTRTYRQMLENFNFEILPTLFLDGGQFRATLLRSPRKQLAFQAPMLLSRYDETFSKMKILISKNLVDLKNAFMFYYSTGHVHFHTHYYEFLENLNNALTYKESLKAIDCIQLIDQNTEDFFFEQLPFRQELLADVSDPLAAEARFYHKLNLYRHVRNIPVNADYDREAALLQQLSRRPDRADLMRYVGLRMVLLAQSVYRRTITSCDLRFLVTPKSVAFSLIHRIQLGDTEFVNDLSDEEDFEAVDFERNKATQVVYGHFKKIERLAHSGHPLPEVEVPRYRHVTQPLVEMTRKYLEKVTKEFDLIAPEAGDSEAAFTRLFPQAKCRLADIVEAHFKKPCLETQLGKLHAEYWRTALGTAKTPDGPNAP